MQILFAFIRLLPVVSTIVLMTAFRDGNVYGGDDDDSGIPEDRRTLIDEVNNRINQITNPLFDPLLVSTISNIELVSDNENNTGFLNAAMPFTLSVTDSNFRHQNSNTCSSTRPLIQRRYGLYPRDVNRV